MGCILTALENKETRRRLEGRRDATLRKARELSILLESDYYIYHVDDDMRDNFNARFNLLCECIKRVDHEETLIKYWDDLDKLKADIAIVMAPSWKRSVVAIP